MDPGLIPVAVMYTLYIDLLTLQENNYIRVNIVLFYICK